jgi:2,5-diketo-D-gluconate reductase A
MTKQPDIVFHDGLAMPQFGLGVWQASDDEARVAVRTALEAGYRSIDTAAIYANEGGVGRGLRESSLAREEIFLTTKIWNSAQGKKSTVQALENSLRLLDTPFVDLLLIHWPVASQGLYVETWEAMIGLRERGLVRSIGVSNFQPDHIQNLIDETGVTPVLNQIELHPYLQQADLRAVHESLGIVTESWSPLAQNQALSDPVLEGIARKHGKTTAQVVIRWHLDNGLVVIPKSVTPSRIQSNIEVFDFSLDSRDLADIAALDENRRIGPDPDKFG